MPEERLQKILARAGFGSRRACEELILAGRVSVNGLTAELGSKANPASDTIRVDGHKLKTADEKLYYAIYKPRGVLSTTAGPDPRPKVTDLVPGGELLHLVGRLDLDSEGLMLLTNDGDLTQQLTHPRYEHEKEYRVLVARQPDAEQLATWRRGVVLPDGNRSLPAEVRIEKPQGKGAWVRVIMREGRKREIREITRQLGLPVVKLLRIRIGALRVGDLQPGEWRSLSAEEVEALRTRHTPLPTPRRSNTSRPGAGRTRPGAKPGGSSRRPAARRGAAPAKGRAGSSDTDAAQPRPARSHPAGSPRSGEAKRPASRRPASPGRRDADATQPRPARSRPAGSSRSGETKRPASRRPASPSQRDTDATQPRPARSRPAGSPRSGETKRPASRRPASPSQRDTDATQPRPARSRPAGSPRSGEAKRPASKRSAGPQPPKRRTPPA